MVAFSGRYVLLNDIKVGTLINGCEKVSFRAGLYALNNLQKGDPHIRGVASFA
jgi:hypothetical protein